MNVKERLKKYIDYESLTISEFEKSIGASNGYVNNISKSIGIDRLNMIIEKYSNLNIEWLLTGKGEMLRQPSSPPSTHDSRIYVLNDELIDIQRKLINNLESEVKRLKHEVNKLEHELEKNQAINKIPMAAEEELKYTKKKG